MPLADKDVTVEMVRELRGRADRYRRRVRDLEAELVKYGVDPTKVGSCGNPQPVRRPTYRA